MRGLEGVFVPNCTEKPKFADYKKLGPKSNNTSKILRSEVKEGKVRVGEHTVVPHSLNSIIVVA